MSNKERKTGHRTWLSRGLIGPDVGEGRNVGFAQRRSHPRHTRGETTKTSRPKLVDFLHQRRDAPGKACEANSWLSVPNSARISAEIKSQERRGHPERDKMVLAKRGSLGRGGLNTRCGFSHGVAKRLTHFLSTERHFRTMLCMIEKQSIKKHKSFPRSSRIVGFE